jgi:hypothetical protein
MLHQSIPAYYWASIEDFLIVEIPGLNRLFETRQRCTASEYGTLAETFSPNALEGMGDWLARPTH